MKFTTTLLFVGLTAVAFQVTAQASDCAGSVGESIYSANACCAECCDPIIPNMIGDGGLLQPRILVPFGDNFHMLSHGWKPSENNSAIPQDRVSFNFNALQGAKIGGGRISAKDVQEFRFSAEKTVLGGVASLEVLVPFYNTSRYNIPDLGTFLEGPQTAAQFGDIGFGAKILLLQRERLALSGGVRIETPTSQDVYIWPENEIDDEIWHFTPYLATQWTNQNRLFANAFAAYRLNTARMHSSSDLASFYLRDAEYLMLDASLGYWLLHEPQSCGLTGLSSVLELHYMTTPTTMGDPPGSPLGILATAEAVGKTDYLNLTAGLTGYWNERITVSGAFSVPLRSTLSGSPGLFQGNTDRTYDWAFLMNMNYHF